MIVITGGAGFIGSAVTWMLNTNGYDDILIVDNLGESNKWKNLVNRNYSDYMHKDHFLNALEKKRFNHIEAIIHMGACSSTTELDADYLMENNYHYSIALTKHALANDIRIINASSAATYGDGAIGFSDDIESLFLLKPLNMYGYSKHLYDKWALKTKALDKLVSLKFFNVFGPNEYHKANMSSLAYKGFFQIQEKGIIRLFKSYHPDYPDGGQKRDFVYVKDCVRIIYWLMENRTVSGLFNIGSGTARTWNALANALFQAMQQPENVEYIDMPESIRDAYQNYTKADMKKLKSTSCPVQLTPLEDAVADYVVNYLQKKDPYL